MLFSFFFLFLLYCRLVSSKCVWELFWWSVGGSCKKDPCDVRGKGQVLYASALTVKSHLRQKKENKQSPATLKCTFGIEM